MDIKGDIFDFFVLGCENGMGFGFVLVSKIIFDYGGWILVDLVSGKMVFCIFLFCVFKNFIFVKEI